ncbi:MAG TPA: hypothetical protein VIE46_11235 [Gemmatimonadales bacterium]
MRSRPGAVLVRRLLAALLLVAFPVMSARMALAGPDHHAATPAHAGHHDGGTPQHPAGHQSCCDFCGAACGCSVHFGSLRLPSAAPVIIALVGPAIVRAAPPARRVAHLLPLALGPPVRSV